MKKLILIALVLLQACAADEGFDLKAPSGFRVSVDLNREASKSDRLFFEGGDLLISRFLLEGDRVQGEDYFFQNGYQPPLLALIDSNFTSDELQFDLPQGIYNYLKIEFEIPSSNIPVLNINGQFKDSTGSWIPLHLAISSFELFELYATDRRGDQEIVIDDQEGYQALIRLNPVHWFSGISLQELEQAERSFFNGAQGIMIDTNNNPEIYQEVNSRLDELNSLVIR